MLHVLRVSFQAILVSRPSAYHKPSLFMGIAYKVLAIIPHAAEGGSALKVSG